MELEVGMYVRTNNNGIAKIKSINNNFLLLDKIPQSVFKNNVLNFSYNIIDLIEVADYVNGYRVVEIYKNNRKFEPSTMIYCEFGNGFIGFYNQDIKSVVACECFESISYKVN